MPELESTDAVSDFERPANCLIWLSEVYRRLGEPSKAHESRRTILPPAPMRVAQSALDVGLDLAGANRLEQRRVIAHGLIRIRIGKRRERIVEAAPESR